VYDFYMMKLLASVPVVISMTTGTLNSRSCKCAMTSDNYFSAIITYFTFGEKYAYLKRILQWISTYGTTMVTMCNYWHSIFCLPDGIVLLKAYSDQPSTWFLCTCVMSWWILLNTEIFFQFLMSCFSVKAVTLCIDRTQVQCIVTAIVNTTTTIIT